MPEAARERTVSFRARAPHSLRIREYPRPKASFTERDSRFVAETETNVKEFVTFSDAIVGGHAASRRDVRLTVQSPQRTNPS
jgi:hypothetical protein